MSDAIRADEVAGEDVRVAADEDEDADVVAARDDVPAAGNRAPNDGGVGAVELDADVVGDDVRLVLVRADAVAEDAVPRAGTVDLDSVWCCR